jgi:hypothetical protein
MLLYLYIACFAAGAISASTDVPLQRAGIEVDNTQARAILGAFQRVSFVSMLVYPFLAFRWYTGIVIFAAFAFLLPILLFRLPMFFNSAFRPDNFLLQLAKIKPLFDVISSVITVYLWINYFFG